MKPKSSEYNPSPKYFAELSRRALHKKKSLRSWELMSAPLESGSMGIVNFLTRSNSRLNRLSSVPRKDELRSL